MIVKYRNKFRNINFKYESSFLYIWYKYHTHFFHSLISRGRKLWAVNFFIRIKYQLKKSELNNPLLIFFVAITNITPEVLLFPLKLGGVTNEVAMPITIRKQIIYSTKWVIKLLKDKYSILKVSNVTTVLLDSIRNMGISVERKELVHKIAKNNRFLMKYYK